jgi:hypothetical protein
MSNLLTDNIYFDCQTYNNTSSNILAQSDDDLSFDILSKTGDYNICITKAQIPLDSIPLTKSNIPLKQYQVTMSQGGFTESAYVRQYNASQDNFLYVANDVSQNITTYKYTSTTVTPQGTTDISSIVSKIFNIAYDDYLNIYVIGNTDGSNVPNTLFIIDSNNQLITSLDFTFIKAFFIDRGQNVYIGDDAEAGSIVYIYSNINGLNAVSLTEVAQLTTDFAGDILHNLNSVCADTLYVIVFHDSNIATFYNPSTYVAISDVTLTGVTGAVKASNMMQDDGTFIISDDQNTTDTLFGLAPDGSSFNYFDITNNNTALLDTYAFQSKLVVVGQYAFMIYNNNTHVVAYPIPDPIPTPYPANTTTSILHIGANKNTLYGSNTYNMYVWNQDSTANNNWHPNFETFSTDGTPAGTQFIDFDFNYSNNKLYAVSSDNKLYISNNQVKPCEIYAVNDDFATVNRYGYDVNQTGGVPVFTSIDTFDIPGVRDIRRSGAHYYTLESDTLANVTVKKRSTSDITNVVLTIALPATFYSSIAVESPYLYVGYDNIVEIYSTTTGILLGTFTSANTSAGSVDVINVLQNDGGTATIALMFATGLIEFVNVATPATPTTISTINDFEGTGFDMCNNSNDLSTAGLDSLILSYGNGVDDGALVLIKMNASFSGIESQVSIYTNTNQVVKKVNCNSSLGQLVCILDNDITFILFQAQNYATPYTLPNLAIESMFVPSSLSHTIFFTEIPIASSQTIKSIAVSKSNPHILYALDATSGLIFSGSYATGETVSFSSAGYTGVYDIISNTTSTSEDSDSKLRLFSLSNQEQVQTVTISNNSVKSIARNDNNSEYLVPVKNSNEVRSYNSSNLTLNYSFGVTTPVFVFAKFGEDITAGPFDIYYMQVLIDAINEALLRCSTRLQAKGSLITPTSQVISLDYSTQLLTLTYDQKFATSPAFINFNAQLLTVCNFINSGGNLVLPPSGSVTQNQKSIFRFNSLTGGKIKFATTTLFVNGNYYGKVTRQQTQNTSSNRIITDLDIPTDTFIDNIGQILYYQPNGTLRPYTMYSNLPLRKVTLQVVYEYRDLQSEYSLYLLPDQNFTVKLNFIKKY